MVKTISAAMETHLGLETTSLATCWKVTRTDGVVLGFTDHDVDLLIDSVTYLASSGYLRSAIASSATMAVDNVELQGFLDGVTLTDDDLRNRLYDYADVEIFVVNWDDLSMGTVGLRSGKFGEIEIRPSGEYRVELRGLVDLLGQKIGNVYQPECRHDLGDSQCQVKLQPDLRVAQKEYAVGDRVVFPTALSLASVDLGITNPDFETGDMTGWTTTTGVSAQADNAWVSAYEGDYYSRHTGGSMRQTLSATPGSPITTAKIDNEEYKVRLAFKYIGEMWGHTYQIEIEFQDASFVTINSGADDYDSGAITIRPYREWLEAEVDVDVPAGTRNILFRITAGEDSEISTDTAPRVGFDDFSMIMMDRTFEDSDDYTRYGGIEFECTVAGTTALATPTWDTVIGNTTVDGSVTWTAAYPNFKWLGEVDTVTSNLEFTEVGDIVGVADDRFNYGVLEWLTGDNAGRKIEVKNWSLSTRTFTLYLPMYYTIAPGDTFVVTTGCDRSRSANTGCKLYDNVINFGGEPEIPGTNKYFKVGPSGGG